MQNIFGRVPDHGFMSTFRIMAGRGWLVKKRLDIEQYDGNIVSSQVRAG